MIKIGMVIGGRHHVHNAAEIFKEHNETEPNPSGEECIMEEIPCVYDNLHNLKTDADALIARGNYAKVLRQYITDRPVVEIPFLATELLKVLQRFRACHGNVKVGIIAAASMVIESDNLGELTGVATNTYIMNDRKEVAGLVERAVADGCQAIAGGTTARLCAEQHGLPHMYIDTGKECFWQAISTAKRAVSLSRLEQERSGKLQTILDTSQNGVLSLNRRGIIDTVNDSACKILNVTSDQLFGVLLQKAPIPSPLKKLLQDDKEYFDEILKLHSSTLTIRKSLLHKNGLPAGMVVTFWQVADIASFETSIRKKIHDKGFVAKAGFPDIIGTSSVMKKTVEVAKKYSRSESNVLLIGQSGVGKEIFAQSIHNHSNRANKPFIAVNCAAVPENLIESEFFGYASGAFTGAQKGGKAGYFELAHTGTIFLDEIGEMPMPLQAKLLRVIQEREIIRIGDGMVTPVDVRIISATNRLLEDHVAQKTFREDLFFRLDVLRVEIPPLDERPEDIPLLIDRFFEGKDVPVEIDPEVYHYLSALTWQGNVRQLFNVCERLMVISGGGYIGMEHVFEATGKRTTPPTQLKVEAEHVGGPEYHAIRDTLIRCQYNRTLAAQQMGMNRTTLWRKMKKYGLGT